MSKKIAKVSPMMHGHLAVEFEDGSQTVLHRGDHEKHELKVGDFYPPVWAGTNIPVGNPEPSADDLDAVAEEQNAAEFTSGESNG